MEPWQIYFILKGEKAYPENPLFISWGHVSQLRDTPH